MNQNQQEARPGVPTPQAGVPQPGGNSRARTREEWVEDWCPYGLPDMDGHLTMFAPDGRRFVQRHEGVAG